MIRLKHPQTNVTKECPTGYSWTTFLFGLFVPLVRGDLKWAAILFVITALVTTFSWALCFIPNCFIGPIFAYFYNKLYITELVEKGYVGNDKADNDWLVENKVIARNN
jgi:hypothetical protein